MAESRQQSAALSTAVAQTHAEGFQVQKSTISQGIPLQLSDPVCPSPSPATQAIGQEAKSPSTLKRQHQAEDQGQGAEGPAQKRNRIADKSSASVSDLAVDNGPASPVAHWAIFGQWPEGFGEISVMESTRAPKKVLALRKRSLGSVSATSTTPTEDRPREWKGAVYQRPQYEELLQDQGFFMTQSEVGLDTTSKELCRDFLEKDQPVPENSLFRDDIFQKTCHKCEGRGEARVVRDISPLLVPSAESLNTYGETALNCLSESVNAGWNNCIPITGTRPQPDYSVGFRRWAFTTEQLDKLSPLLGDRMRGDRSYIIGPWFMYFPFLACEVKSGATGLDVGDRQNAHSMFVGARAIVELLRLVKCEQQVHRQILTWSITHDDKYVRIFGYYPVIDGEKVLYYRHPIHEFSFTALDGKEKWTTYKFTMNVYRTWMPAHFKMICSAIDALPAQTGSDEPLLEASMSQSPSSHGLQSITDQQAPDASNLRTADSSISESGPAKKAKTNTA